MGTRANVYINGKFLCGTKYDSMPIKLGVALSTVRTNWIEILLCCKEYSITFIETDFLLKEPEFVYNCLDKFQREDLKGLAPEVMKDLRNGVDYDDITIRVPIELYDTPFDLDEDFQYNHFKNRVFVRYGLKNFPWVPLEDLEETMHSETRLEDILYEMCGFIYDSDWIYDIKEKVRLNGPISSGRLFILACKRQTQMMPDDPNSWWNYGISLELMNKYPLAIEAYLKAKRLTPNNPIIWRLLSKVYLKNNQIEESKQYLSKSFENLNQINNFKKIEEERKLLEEILYKLNDNDLLEKFYKKLIDHYLLLESDLSEYQRREIWQLLAVLYYKIRDIESSIQAFKKSISLILDSIDINSSFWYSHYKKSKETIIKKAEKLEDKSILSLITDKFSSFIRDHYSKNPNDPYLTFLSGQELFNQKEINGGLELIKKSISIYKNQIKEGERLNQLKFDIQRFLKTNNLIEIVNDFLSDERASDEEMKIIEDLENIIGDKMRYSALEEKIWKSGYKIKDKHIYEIQIDNDIKSLPDSIGDLESLEILNLRSNKLIQLPESISKLTKLRELNLGFNDLTSLPDSIGNLKSLEILSLKYNKFESFPQEIFSLYSLKKLNLESLKLNKTSEKLGQLINLEDLSLHSNQLTTLPSSIKNLKSLKSLDIGSNNFTSLPNFIGNLSSLEVLNLEYNKNLSSLPNSLTYLKKLNELNLSKTNLNPLPEFIGEIQSLKSLMIEDLGLKELPTTFKNLKSLEKVSFSRNFLNPPPKILVGLISLKELNFHNNRITIIPDYICEIKALKKLSFYYNKLTSLPDSISKLQNLEELNLNSNNLISLPNSLLSLKSLKTLEITSNDNLDFNSEVIKKLKERGIWVH